ncbi:PD-(D/E)XK motif protein [Pseudarthrobacter sulfonivorans]|uniref:PD-(D/E)XK motif protein n=1 Tax=Pseudarthrobacter sulfonivorans TaxID=121292 RepID=UPI00210751AC|nr:PD-(D/E)XK motif protein [Pseudarthrobacter sulfonivorans]
MMSNLQHRFFDPDSLERLFAEREISRHRVIDSPRCEITIDPIHEEIALTAPAEGPEPDISKFSRISFAVLGDGPASEFEVRVDATDAHFEAYNILTAIIDELFAGSSFARATTEALGNYKALLRGKSGLSAEQQHGLYGELLLMRQLISLVGEASAVDAWLGPASEQHDFVFSAFDAECKTTTSEKRIHVIGSASQLEKNPGRDLWLISVQITRAGLDSGESLNELVTAVARSLDTETERFWGYLKGLGWRREDADLYSQRFMLRSPIQTYLVTDDFPAITTAALKSVVPHFETVSDVSYRVDVSSREPAAAPTPLNQAISIDQLV